MKVLLLCVILKSFYIISDNGGLNLSALNEKVLNLEARVKELEAEKHNGKNFTEQECNHYLKTRHSTFYFIFICLFLN